MSEEKLCTHTHDSGQPCQAFRVHGSTYCYFHRKFHQPTAVPGERGYQAPLLESHESIQLATTHLYQSFVTGKIPLSAARFALNLLRLASKTTFAIEKNRKEEEKKKQEEKRQEEDGRRSPSTGKDKSTVEQPPSEAPANPPSVGPGFQARSAEHSSADKPAGPAYQGSRYVDPYGCMPREEVAR